jgi:hypothetical protein
MISPAKLAANRANAKKSTGPRSAAGKRRSSQNARRHGLSTPPDAVGIRDIAALARIFADPQPHVRVLATQIAVAQQALERARGARLGLFAQAEAGDTRPEHIRRLAAIEDYERRARTRLKRALLRYNAAIRLFSAAPAMLRTGETKRAPKKLAAKSHSLGKRSHG